MNERAVWIGGVALGATALVAGLAYASGKQGTTASSSTTPTPAPLPRIPPRIPPVSFPPVSFPPVVQPPVVRPPPSQQGVPDPSTVYLSPGVQNTTQDPATTITLSLPAGGTWSPNNPLATAIQPAPISGVNVAGAGPAPAGNCQVYYDGSAPATILLGWIDVNGMAQTTSLAIYPTVGKIGVTMSPGAHQSLSVMAGTLVVIQIPGWQDGGGWSAQNMPDPQPVGVAGVNAQRSGVSPSTLVYMGPGSVTVNLAWMDANNVAQTTQLTIA